MERLVAMMAFCEAPFDGTLAPSGAARYYSASTTAGYSKVAASLAAAMNKWPMEKLASTMAFCEAPFDGTSAPSGAARYYSASATAGYSKVVASLAAAMNKWPMEKLASTMAFCEAPLDGTSALSSVGTGRGYSASATGGGGGNVVASLDAAAKKWPVERLVATMAFCEAPFDCTFDGTTSSSGAAGGSSASATNVPGAGAAGEDAKALRRAWLADFKKEWPLREHPLLLREKAGTVVDGLTIFETVALQ